MKLVDLTCPGCGANVKVDSNLKTANCTVCGKQMLIAHSGEFGEGYDREMGRLQAIRDSEEQWQKEREEKIRLEEEEKKRREEEFRKNELKRKLKVICIAETVFCFMMFISAFSEKIGVIDRNLRIPGSFIQLALVAAVVFLASKDKLFTWITLACVICTILSLATTLLSTAFVFFLLFNAAKLFFLFRVELVSHSWNEIIHSVKK